MIFNFAILKPDKGNGIVVMKWSDYIFSGNSLFDNRHKFKKVFTNPTSTRLSSLQTYLSTLFKQDEISDDEFKFLRPIKLDNLAVRTDYPKLTNLLSLFPHFD